MKNYVVIVKQTNGSVFATLYNTTTLDVFAAATVAALVATCSTLEDVSSMNDSDFYKIEGDAIEGSFETAIRNIGFRRCDVCGAWVAPQDVRNGASIYDRALGIRKCASCLSAEAQREASSKKISLGGYHSTSNFKVWSPTGMSEIEDTGRYVGIEMEINGANCSVRNGTFKATEEFYSIANNRSRKQVFHCERDSTVAAEFISNCFTEQSLREFDWNILTGQTKKLGNDEKCAEVGFHIHLSKAFLGENEEEQVNNFLKLQYVLNKYEEDWFRFSGRNSRSEMRYCNFWNLDQIENLKNRSRSWDSMPCCHNTALISSRNTVELRICHSTNDSERIRNTLELVLGLVKNIKNVRWEKLWCLGKLFKEVPQETMAYWRKKGCFLNTMALDTRGMSI